MRPTSQESEGKTTTEALFAVAKPPKDLKVISGVTGVTNVERTPL